MDAKRTFCNLAIWGLWPGQWTSFHLLSTLLTKVNTTTGYIDDPGIVRIIDGLTHWFPEQIIFCNTRSLNLPFKLHQFMQYSETHFNVVSSTKSFQAIRGLALLNMLELVHLDPSIWSESYSSSKQQLVRPISVGHRPAGCPTTPCAQRYCLTQTFLPWTSLNSQTTLDWWLDGIERKGKIYLKSKHASWESVLARVDSGIVSNHRC